MTRWSEQLRHDRSHVFSTSKSIYRESTPPETVDGEICDYPNLNCSCERRPRGGRPSTLNPRPLTPNPKPYTPNPTHLIAPGVSTLSSPSSGTRVSGKGRPCASRSATTLRRRPIVSRRSCAPLSADCTHASARCSSARGTSPTRYRVQRSKFEVESIGYRV